MSIDVFYSRPGHLIRRLNQISVALFLEEVGPLDLTPRQYAVLHMIEEVPGIDQASLSNMIAVDKTTMVKLVDRLVDKELITRTRSQTDRRANHLHVTEKGRALLAQVVPCLDRSDQRILAPLSPDEQHEFMATLSELVHVNNMYSRAPQNSEVLETQARRGKSGKPAKVSATP